MTSISNEMLCNVGQSEYLFPVESCANQSNAKPLVTYKSIYECRGVPQACTATQ